MPSASSPWRSSSTTGREAVAPTAAFFIAAKFLPALLAPALTARLDQISLRRSLPGLYVLEAAAFAALALIASGDFFLPLVLALGLLDGALAITGRGLTRGAVASILQPAGAAQGRQRADEHRLRGRLGRRRGARPAS